jgi:hypothetical protein
MRWLARSFADGGPKKLAARGFLAVLYAPVMILTIGGIEYWALPQHYAIAAIYGVAAAILIALAVGDVRRLRASKMD